jgi:hypothetical protein
LHHFCNRGAKDVILLWRDSEGTEANIKAEERAAKGHLPLLGIAVTDETLSDKNHA